MAIPIPLTFSLFSRSLSNVKNVIRYSNSIPFPSFVRYHSTINTLSSKSKTPIPDTKLTVEEAISLLKAHPNANPTHYFQTNIKCMPMVIPQPIQRSLILPHPCSKKMTILCFAEGKDAEAAKAAGADIVGSKDLIDKITNDELKFDLVLSTPEAFNTVKSVARILGPMGHMPSVKKGTVVTDIGEKVEALKLATTYTCTKRGNMMMVVGTLSDDASKIKENLNYILKDLVQSLKEIPNQKTRPKQFISKVWLTARLSPAFPLSLSQFDLSPHK